MRILFYVGIYRSDGNPWGKPVRDVNKNFDKAFIYECIKLWAAAT